MPRVTHFEIPADYPERAARFYEEAFGWQIKKWDGPEDYWLATTGATDEPGINGAIIQRDDLHVTRNSINVPSIEEFIGRIVKAGGRVRKAKITIPRVGYRAYCEDTEGNLFIIMEKDSEAQ